MSDQPQQTLKVLARDEAVHRGGQHVSTRIFDVDVYALSENVNVFLTQMNTVLENTPEATGGFHLTEFTITAEISGKGTLTLLGSGGELAASGGITFKFEKT